MFTWLLHKTHRWGGVTLALFMVTWLVSGLIIVFVPPITVKHAQQLAHAERLAPTPEWLSLGRAWTASLTARRNQLEQLGAVETQAADRILSARLAAVAGQPQWQVIDGTGRRWAVSALNGGLLLVTPDQAERIAAHWLGGGRAHYADTLDAPGSLRNYKELGPFHRVVADDAAGTELLISSRTGDVLQAATRVDRGFYRLGNWLHFFRVLEDFGSEETRRTVLMWAGGIAFAASVTGMIIGWQRWRPGVFGRPTYAEGRTQPYRRFWLRWHFWAGLIGGAAAVFWTASGTLANNPWHVFSGNTPSLAELSRFGGMGVSKRGLDWKPQSLSAAAVPVAEAVWSGVDGTDSLILEGLDGRAFGLEGYAARFGADVLSAAAARLVSGAKVAQVSELDAYDDYYYLIRNRDIWDRPLPVVRIELDDPSRTWVYADPADGRVLAKLDAGRRVYRWLFSSVHRWDFSWLYGTSAWLAWILALAGGGLIIGVSGVVLGWRRVRITVRNWVPRAERPSGAGKGESAVGARMV